MHCRRFRKVAVLSALGVLMAPPLLWVLIVLVAPTNWARAHVVAALEKGSGRAVQLDDLGVCLGGGISLTSLRIGAPGAISDPWLRAQRIEIDVSPLQLLCGHFEPSRLDVDGAELRVLRRGDGSLELADLVSTPGGDRDASASTGGQAHHCGSCKLRVQLHRTSLLVIDEPTQTRMTFDGVEGEAVVESDGAVLVTLTGRWNRGPFQFTMHLGPSAGGPAFDGQFRCNDVEMDQGMAAIRYAVPVLAGAPVELQGRLGANVYLSGRGSTWAAMSRSLLGHGNLALDPVALSGAPLVNEFTRIARQRADEAVGSVHTDFVVRDGRIRTDNLTMQLGRFPVNVSGWTAFDGSLDYQVRMDSLTGRIPDKARRYMNTLDLDVDSLTSLHLSGTVDRVNIRSNLGGEGRAAVDRLLTPDERQRLKVLGRQLREKILR